MSTPHHIVFVVAEPWHTAEWSTDLGLIIRELRQNGHEASMTCTKIVGPPADFPTFEASLEQMSDPTYWKARRPTIAVVFNWLIRANTVLPALREAGAYAIQYGDSDGLEGMRVHPTAQITRMWNIQRSLPDKLSGMIALAKKYIYTHRKEDALLLNNLAVAHRTTLTSETGRDAFLRFVHWAGRSDLTSRVAVLPSPLAPAFLALPVRPRPRPVIVAVGRWADPQKDAPLMAETLRAYLKDAPPETEVRLIGGGGEPFFAPLTCDLPQVRYLGKIPHGDVAQQLSEARILFFSSRWEGVPVVSLEMVALGGTVVGPKSLPGIAQYAAKGQGATSTKRTPESLAGALLMEMDAWEQGRRDPKKIAAEWRPRLTPARLAEQIVTWAENKNE